MMKGAMKISLRVSQAEKYPAKQHAQRVATQLGCKDGLIYLLGQYAYNKEDSDMPKTWYQRRFFYYMSGVDEPNCCLTYNMKTHDLILYIPDINWNRVVWTGRGSTVEEAREKYDVDDVRLNSQLFPDLQEWLNHRCKDATVHILHKDHVPQGVKLPVNVDSLFHAMELCRAIKDPHEVELIKKANGISTAAHRAVLEKLPTAMNEADLSAVFQAVCISHFTGQAYAPIVGSGANASTLHYTANNEPLKGRQLICLDAGSTYKLYASDVTRTFPISGEWTKEAKAVYALVEKIQDRCIAVCKEGVHFIDLDNLCHDLIIRGLLELGVLCNGTPEEIYDAGTSRGFYPHGLGHHLGLECHDTQGVPIMRYFKPHREATERCNPVLDLPTTLGSYRSKHPPLEAGMVVTVEPGVYFNEQYLKLNFLNKPEHAKYINVDILDKYYAVGGVRIEDDILITKEGYVNLTPTPKGEDALKIIRQAYKKDFVQRITDWYGLDPSTFGNLIRHELVQLSHDGMSSWQEVVCLLCDHILLCAKDNGSSKLLIHRSVLIRKHLIEVDHISDQTSLVLKTSITAIPQIWLRFSSQARLELWAESLESMITT